MSDLDRIMARLDALEAENAALRSALDILRATPVAPPLDEGGAVSRRGLLRRAGVGAGTLALGVVGAGMASLSGPQVARAGTPNDPIDLTTDKVTAIKGKSTHPQGVGVQGIGNDIGVDGQGSGNAGVRGYGVGSTVGVLGYSNAGPSIKAEKDGESGVALVAEVTNADNPNSAIRAVTAGGGPVVFTRSAGSYSIEAEKTTNGTCIIGIIDKADSPAAAVAGNTSGTGRESMATASSGPASRDGACRAGAASSRAPRRRSAFSHRR